MTSDRIAVCVVLVVSAGVAVRLAAGPPVQVLDMSRLPVNIGSWHGEDRPLDEDVVRQLGADAYVNRDYTTEGEPPVGVYVAFYAGQKPGASIHSPLNCLPGTGWEPAAVGTIAASAALGGGAAGTMRRMVVRKEDRQALVLYWYHVHGRTLASEWDSRRFLLFDSLRMRRSDASFVRIVVPIAGDARLADAQGRSFLDAFAPSVGRLWGKG